MNTLPTWADAKYGEKTIDGGVKGAGRECVIRERDTDEQHVDPTERYTCGDASPEAPVAEIRLSKETRALIEELGPELGAEVAFLCVSPTHLVHNIGVLGDFEGGVPVGLAILRDNGWLPATATYQQADDLIATRYTDEGHDQRTARTMRAMGTAIAAGEDAELVLGKLAALGPASCDFALRIARRAGQAADIEDPEAVGLWEHIWR